MQFLIHKCSFMFSLPRSAVHTVSLEMENSLSSRLQEDEISGNSKTVIQKDGLGRLQAVVI